MKTSLPVAARPPRKTSDDRSNELLCPPTSPRSIGSSHVESRWARGLLPERRQIGDVDPLASVCSRPLAGFTLIELLVVIAIIATIFGLMLVGSRPGESSEVRRAAQQFASALLSAQSRGMGNPSGAAVVLESLGLSAVSVFNADVPPLIPATVSGGIPPEDPNAAAIDVWIDARGIDLARGLRIQFLGTAPTMPPSAWFGFKPPGTVLMRVDEGQTPFNTLWPSVMGGQCEARISSYPAKGDLALRFPRLAVIELRYSGTGDDPATSWGGLADKGDVGLSFDSLGAIDSVSHGLGDSAAAASRQPTEPVYFLIATRQDATDDTALASERSLWVAVQPLTGRVTISANVPQQGRDATALRAARALARAAAKVVK